MTQPDPSPDEMLLIGVVGTPFGVRGQMRVRAYTDQIEHLRKRIRTVYLGEKRRPYTLELVYEHKPGLLVMALDGVKTREAAEELRGCEVAILEREAAPLGQDEYFIHQLYGLLVLTEEGEEIGRVHEVLETGANEVLVVKRPDQPDALIPMIHDIVRFLDIPSGRLVVRLVEGLL